MADYIESDDVGLAQFFTGLNDQDHMVSDMKKQWILDNTADPTFFQGLIDRGIVEPEFFGSYGASPVSINNQISCLGLRTDNDFMLILRNIDGKVEMYGKESDNTNLWRRAKIWKCAEERTPNEILKPVSSFDPKSVNAKDRANIRYCISHILAPYLDAPKRGRLLDLVRELEHRENRDPSEPASYLDLVYPRQSL